LKKEEFRGASGEEKRPYTNPRVGGKAYARKSGKLLKMGGSLLEREAKCRAALTMGGTNGGPTTIPSLIRR